MLRKVSYLVVLLLLVFAFSACGAISEDTSDSSVVLSRNYSISEEDFKRIHELFDSGRYGTLYVSEASGEYADWLYSYFDVILVPNFVDDAPVSNFLIINPKNANEKFGQLSIQFDSFDDWGFLAPSIFNKELSRINHSFVDGYDDLLLIMGSADDSSGSFTFELATRTWGEKWDDVANSEPDSLPPMYYDWYLPLIKDGKSMPTD